MVSTSEQCCYVVSGCDVNCTDSLATGVYVSLSWAAIIHLAACLPLMDLHGTSTCLIMTPASKVTFHDVHHHTLTLDSSSWFILSATSSAPIFTALTIIHFTLFYLFSSRLETFFFNKFFPAETTGTIQTALTLFCILVSLLSQITGLYGSSDSSHFSFSLIFSLSCITLMSTVNGSLLLLDDDMI